MTCANCEKAKTKPTGTYNFNLECCRTRFIQTEPCKYLRKVLVDYYRPRYGEFDAWQEGRHCNCQRVCQRLAAVNEKKTMDRLYEQSVNANRKKASRRR